MLEPTRCWAPGRVNLIGEHTDYNQGFVLPTVIPQRTRATLTPRADRLVVATSRELGGPVEYHLGQERRRGGWIDYVQGCTQALTVSGYYFAGFELALESEVPVGSGLSSSAALEIAVLRAIRAAFDLNLDDVALAKLGQRAENVLVGAPVGLMDQLVSSLGYAGAALFVDTRSLAVRAVPLPPADLIVIASGVAHDHARGDYRARRAECERAAKLLGVSSLRELAAADLARADALPDPLPRRVRHVVTENARVLAAVDALDRGDTLPLGPLFAASHRSMRDDYEVSIEAIDRLVAIADDDRDVIGARLTGGGFGGSIVALAERDRGRDAAARIARAYAARTGHTPQVLVPPPEAP